MFNMKEVESLSKKYNIPQADILLIALNRYGIRANIDDNRIRFKRWRADDSRGHPPA